MRPSLFHSSRRIAGQRGFSLIELMIAVVIIGVLASAAAVAISPDPDVEDEAQKIAALVNEAARLAISGGPVDPNGNLTGSKSRARMLVKDDGQGQYLLIQRLDDQAGFDDIDRKRAYLGRRVRVVGWTPAGITENGLTPLIAFNASFPPTISCRPDGTCTVNDIDPPTGATLYLQDVQRPDRKARVVVLPLNGMMSQVFSGW